MDDKIQKMMEDVIKEEIENLSSLDAGTKEKSAAVEDLKKLYELKIEEAKVEQAKCEKREELDTRWAQIDAQAKDRWINIGVQIGLTIASLVAYDVWYRRGLKFEETGSITAPMTRNLLSRMLPGRK